MNLPSFDTIVIGAGAAGMMAAYRAAADGRRTLLLEKNRKLGVKILISGGTRCNLTHDASAHEIAAAFPKSQRRFLGSALAMLPPDRLLEFFRQAGVATKVEAAGKVFPVSNRAIDVRDALVQQMLAMGVEVRAATSVLDIHPTSSGLITTTAAGAISGSAVVVACGGQSYPGCGTTGDGYAWARRLGHHVVAPVPALVPIRTSDSWLTSLQGVTIPDARLTVTAEFADEAQGRRAARHELLDQRRGSLLLTHVGLSGPVTLDISRVITQSSRPDALDLTIDFWPAVNEDQCRESMLATVRQAGKKLISSLQIGPLPSRLVGALLRHAQVDASQRLAELGKSSIQKLTHCVKQTSVTLSGSLGFAKAEVTAGGVALDEVNPKTMESKLVPRCYFVGEVLDIDGPIGGYNFQAAFSTGWLAGESV